MKGLRLLTLALFAFALSAVVTREGRVSTYKLLLSKQASGRRRQQAAELDQDVPALLEGGRRRAEAEGLEVVFQTADAEALPFPAASFDVARPLDSSRSSVAYTAPAATSRFNRSSTSFSTRRPYACAKPPMCVFAFTGRLKRACNPSAASSSAA